MARALSAEDKRIIADIERQLAERKKAKGGAKELEAELKKARKGRTVAKFNSKGQTAEKAKTKVKSTRGKPPTAKKPEAKKPEAKTKVKSTRGKPPTVKKPEAKKPTVKKPEAKKPTVKKPAAKKPTVKKKAPTKLAKSLRTARGKPVTPNTNNVGPAGERISGSSRTVVEKGGQRSKASMKGGRLASVGKNILRFGGPMAAISAGASLYNAVHPDEVKKRTSASKAGFGTKKKVKKKPQVVTKKPPVVTKEVVTPSTNKETAKKKSTTTSSFGTAFRTARDKGLKVFSWNGKKYSTATKDDVKKSGSKDLREHLNKQNKKSK